MSLKALIIYIHLPRCIYGVIISCLNDSVSWLFCLYSFYRPPTSSSLPFIFLKYVSDNVACLLKKKKIRGQYLNLSVWHASLLAIYLWSYTPLTSPTSALRLFNAPATEDCLSFPDTQGLCVLLAPSSARNVLPYPFNKVQLKRYLFCGLIVTVLSCTLPCFIPNKLLLPQYLQRKYQMKKSLLNIYYLNILVLGRQKCISQVLLWNSEFIWGRTRANQWLQYNGLNVW